MTDSQQQIVPGISVSSSGQASVDPSLADVLFDLALQLEGPTDLPVDVEHVLAAIVLAARNGELAPDKPLRNVSRITSRQEFSFEGRWCS